MKLKYIMNTEMWIPGAGVCKQGKIIDKKNPKEIGRLLRSGMFKEVKSEEVEIEMIEPIKVKVIKLKKKKVKKSKKKGVDN